VKRYTIDNTGWDYFVGGHAYGNTDWGYVVYLGGHSYADCKDDKDKAEDKDKDKDQAKVNPELHVHPMDIEFKEEPKEEEFRLVVRYDWKSVTHMEYISFSKATLAAAGKIGMPLEIDLTQAEVKKKTLRNLIFRNTDNTAPITIISIGLFWNGGHKLKKQSVKKMTDLLTDVDHINKSPYDFRKPGTNPWDLMPWDAALVMAPVDFVIEPASGISPGPEPGPGPVTTEFGCTANGGCTAKNVAGVRYVLNTLFSIKYEVNSYEYVRSAPIVKHPWLYQGSFEHPSYAGHFRRYHVEAQEQNEDWDTAVGDRIAEAGAGNVSGRKVYTASYDDVTGDWSRIDFDAGNVDALVSALNIEPADNGTADEIKVIERLRGREYNDATAGYDEIGGNRLGGIMHSAPVIVRAGDSRVGGSRDETAYVGDVYGMLHAIDTSSGNENWAFIPANLLGRLKNERTDPAAEPLFAAVDGSPTALDLFYDHDDDGDSEWRTILVCAEGFGGTSIFALDVTDPDNFDVLWEAADDPTVGGLAPGGGLGYAYRTSIDKVKVPALDSSGNPTYDYYGNPVYEVKWTVFVATSFLNVAEEHGGINVFAFDLKTGAELWTFSSTYANSVNDIPGAVTTNDIDDDSFADRLYVGDMNGRMWELALTDDPDGKLTAGESVHTAEVADDDGFGGTSTLAIPLFNAGIDNPISVSPAVIDRNGHVMLIFGTGGADWASDKKGYHLFAVDATAADTMTQSTKSRNYTKLGGAINAIWSLPLAKGEKVWSSPTISAGQIWLVTSYGTMESNDPRNDRKGKSVLRALDLDGVVAVGTPLTIDSKIRGSVYVSNKHLYMTTMDNRVIQIGDGDHTAGTGNRVVLKSWQHKTEGTGTTTSVETYGDETGMEQGEMSQFWQ